MADTAEGSAGCRGGVRQDSCHGGEGVTEGENDGLKAMLVAGATAVKTSRGLGQTFLMVSPVTCGMSLMSTHWLSCIVREYFCKPMQEVNEEAILEW